jgi:hypothetical protein
MAAAAMLEIQVNAIKWAITIRFDANWYAEKEKYAEFENHTTGSDNQVSRWPPPPYWELKSVLNNGQLPPDFDANWYTD